MFFIVNKTKKTVHLSDLKITLGPRQAIDLDEFVDRRLSEASKSLRAAKSQGEIEIRVKDNILAQNEEKSQPLREDGDDIGELKRMISDMKGVVEALVSKKESISPVSGSVVSQEDLEKIAKTIISHLPEIKETVKKDGVSSEDKVDMDEDLLSTINARVIDRMVKNAEVKSVHYKEDEAENTILNNVNELENLFG